MGETQFSHDKSVRAYNWAGVPPFGSMRSLKINFSHPVKIDSIYLNDGRANMPHPDKTYLKFQAEDEIPNVTIQLQDAEVQEGGEPYKNIWIEFRSTNKHVKMKEFIWFASRDARGPKKIASPDILAYFNEQFYLAPPPPPVITLPRDGTTSYNDMPEMRGTAEASSTVVVIVDGERKKPPTTSDEFGVWRFRISTPLHPRNNKFKFTAKLIDFEGNESEESAPVYYTVTA